MKRLRYGHGEVLEPCRVLNSWETKRNFGVLDIGCEYPPADHDYQLEGSIVNTAIPDHTFYR